MCTRKKDVEKLSCGFEVIVNFELKNPQAFFSKTCGNIVIDDYSIEFSR